MGMLPSITKASNQDVYDKDSVGFKIGNSCKVLVLALFFFQMKSICNIINYGTAQLTVNTLHQNIWFKRMK